MLKIFPSDKINVTKIQSFLFCELQLITVLLLIRNSYMSWSTWFISLKLWVEFSIFYSVSFLLNLIFLFSKSIDSPILKLHNFFQNKNNRKATHRFAPRPLIFKLEQEVRKFNDICVSWSSPKTELERTFLTSKIEVLSTSVFLNSNF